MKLRWQRNIRPTFYLNKVFRPMFQLCFIFNCNKSWKWNFAFFCLFCCVFSDRSNLNIINIMKTSLKGFFTWVLWRRNANREKWKFCMLFQSTSMLLDPMTKNRIEVFYLIANFLNISVSWPWFTDPPRVNNHFYWNF